ncbi:integrase core domain-containing protein [Kaistia terrae]|uniref:Integrase core domain-containing protein n=1 Tax=Kaistia terrae TaxID=537017 RepID=A0ABW0PW62_9HYPH
MACDSRWDRPLSPACRLIPPGKSTQNAFAESLDGCLREEWLIGTPFSTLSKSYPPLMERGLKPPQTYSPLADIHPQSLYRNLRWKSRPQEARKRIVDSPSNRRKNGRQIRHVDRRR